MRRTLSQMMIAKGKTRYRVVLETDPCPPGSQQALIEQFRLLGSLADSPDLVSCGPARFQTLQMSHNGLGWVVEAEAVVEEET